jgi:hypothetical protein
MPTTSPRSRNLSILSPFRSRAPKQRAQKERSTRQTGSEPPPSLERIPVAPAPATPAKMPPTLKDRGGRLTNFARANSDGSAVSAHNHDQAHRNQPSAKRSETPQTAAPTRQELVDAAKVPVPKSSRYVSSPRNGSVVSHSAPQSPPHAGGPQGRRTRASSNDRRNRQERPDRHDALFGGSQLGDGFMNSGLTTPHNERIDTSPEPTRQPKKSPSLSQHPLLRGQFEPGSRGSDEAAFYISDDGFMRVVTGSGHHASNMKDGFQDSNMNERINYEDANASARQLATSPTPRKAKLPMREVKVKKQTDRRNNTAMPEDARVSSPTFESTRWQAQQKKAGASQHLFREIDGELSSCAELEEPQTTPKASKTKAVQKTLLESSMPVTRAIPQEPREKKRRRASLDYDDKTLAGMAYSELQAQGFDFNPSSAAVHPSPESKGDETKSLLLRYLPQSEKEQRHMFANMPITDWEASGDWFIDQYVELMGRLRDARQKKRRVMRAFEDEITSREEMVRVRSDAIDRKLSKMQQDGQRVVEDKEL